MAIYQGSTNDAPCNSVVTSFRTFERTGLYNLLAATPLIAWYGFVVTLQLPFLAHQMASLDLATAEASEDARAGSSPMAPPSHVPAMAANRG
ncbi:MAG: hypothetical protein ACLPZ0_11715 [Steroidobacteraceae bacterium]